MNIYKTIVLNPLTQALAVFFLAGFALIVRLGKLKERNKPRLLWGFDGILNDSYYARALQEAGYVSHSYTLVVYNINKTQDFDFHIKTKGQFLYYLFYTLACYDIFHVSFNGGLITRMGLGFAEPFIYRLAGIKTVITAYGSDIHVYDKIRKPFYAHALMSFYYLTARRRKKVVKNIERWSRHADFLNPVMFAGQGFYRWDIVMPNALVIDTGKFTSGKKKREKPDPLKVVHSPNHRIIKGTEYIIKAVDDLQRSGYDIELILLEKMSNDEVLHILQNEADILVEKLVGPSYALSAIEGMASGLPVISNIDTEDWHEEMKLYRRYSFLDECPLISANCETIKDVLAELYTNPEKRKKSGQAGIAYVEKYHSFRAAQILYPDIYDKIYFGERGSLINYFHPLAGSYSAKFENCA